MSSSGEQKSGENSDQVVNGSANPNPNPNPNPNCDVLVHSLRGLMTLMQPHCLGVPHLGLTKVHHVSLIVSTGIGKAEHRC